MGGQAICVSAHLFVGHDGLDRVAVGEAAVLEVHVVLVGLVGLVLELLVRAELDDVHDGIVGQTAQGDRAWWWLVGTKKMSARSPKGFFKQRPKGAIETPGGQNKKRTLL